MIARFYGKILCGLALLLALGASAGMALRKPSGVARRAAGGAVYSPAPEMAAWTKTAAWREPAAGKDGWRYDVFTPPVVYYDSLAKKFSVTPPESRETRPAGEAAFGLELREVRRTPGRLQLVGYVSGNGGHLGAFENTLTGEIFLARVGQQPPDLGLTIKNFEVRRMRVDAGGDPPALEIAAVAEVRDDRTGEDFVLTNQRRLLNGPPLAVLAVDGGSAAIHTLKEGETMEVFGAVYRVEKIQFDPPQAVVTKASAGAAEPVEKVLQPKFDKTVPAPATPLK